MNSLSIIQRPPSRQTLGTVQLGMDYGIANRTGRPSFKAVCDIIHEAYRGGIDVLDTAASYGGSEEVIGQALRELKLRDHIRVVTKIAHFSPTLSRQEAARHIESSVTQSLKHLGVDRIPLCLFHSQNYLPYMDELLPMVAKGWIEAVGVSIVDEEGARKALAIPELRAWQIPSNLIDRRFTHSGLTAAANKAGVIVFVRSVYLQGLLVMEDADTPGYLHPLIESRRRFREVAKRFGLPMTELAMRAILSRPDIQSIVVGAETVAQVQENTVLAQKGPLPAEVLAAIDAVEITAPVELRSPVGWAQAKADYKGP